MNNPKSLDELKKLRVAEAMRAAESQAAKEWEQLQVKTTVRDFVEKHGGVKATVALIEAVYGVKSARAGKRSKRTTVTGEIRAKIEKLLRENKTAKTVAEAVGVSIPTVNNHKRLLGLTKPRIPVVATKKSHGSKAKK